MKRSLTRLQRILLVLLPLAGLAPAVRAQLPQCLGNGGFVYIESSTQIRNWDPTLPLGPTNPVLNTITIPGGSGLAVSVNLNGVGPSPTFYTTIGGTYWYYNGTGWTNTGHSTGSAAAVNPGAGGGYIYNIVGASGQIYRYDGTGPAVLCATITDFLGGGPYDLQVDCAGNFYLLKGTTSGTGQWMRKYSPNGTLLQSWTLNGIANVGAGPGFAIIGSTVYYFNNTNYYVGAITGSVVNFTPSTPPAVTGGDWGSCELGGINSVNASIDTGYYCGSGPGIPVTSTGAGVLHWTVLSGSASITTTGNNSATFIPTSTISRIEVRSDSISLCGSGNRDTFTLVRPLINVDAGVSDTVLGCGSYRDTLQGAFNGLPAFTNFSLNWTPAASVVSGGNTVTPIIAPTAYTRYYLNVTTPANQGSCLWRDSVDIWVKNLTVNANYTFDIHYGCTEDTVIFASTSTSAVPLRYNWIFGDGSADTVANPTHIYATQNIYNVKMLAYNGQCRDSVTKPVDITHPLNAVFATDKDSICQGDFIQFTDNSITTTKFGIGPKYFWEFGDGTTSAAQNPSHTYPNYGVYQVRLRVTDFVPCTDTAYKTIIVDSTPYARFTLSDSILCEGAGIRFLADFLPIGNTGIRWDFGDGTVLDNTNPISHAYDTSGTYTVKLDAYYRLCPDQDFSRNVVIRSHPFINIGPDTAICPGGPGVALFDRNPPTPGATYLWNTGQTTPLIAANAVGSYWASISLDGCTTTDSVEVRKDCYLDVPNAFTPNGDGDNDYFLPRELLGRSVSTFHMLIYNRWGQIIFETRSTNGRGWDGRFNGEIQPAGVYIYRIDAGFANGVNQNWTGNVTLLR